MWHEARRSEKKVHDMMDAAHKRAQRRAVFLAKRRGDPQQAIQLIGSRCRTYRDDGLYQATEDHQGLIPWNGKDDVLIDRFDGRALLDFIREPGSRHFRTQEKSEEEEELEEFVNFERYRDLIKHRRRGFTDEGGLQHVNQAMEAKAAAPFVSDRSQLPQAQASKGSYSQEGQTCVRDSNCDSGLHCETCLAGRNVRPKCSLIQPVKPISKVKGLPFNRYSWLTNHYSFAEVGAESATESKVVTFENQQDSITSQLNNGVRGLMLDLYDFNNDIWLCHSFRGKCYNNTAFQPAVNVLRVVGAFLEANPTEVVTIILEDYVTSPRGLTKVFDSAGLRKYWFPDAETRRRLADGR